MTVKTPKISKVVAEKYAGNPAIFFNGKIVHIGEFSTKKEYKEIMGKLMEKYPEAKEEEFGFTFIFGKRNYILTCTSKSPTTKADQV